MLRVQNIHNVNAKFLCQLHWLVSSHKKRHLFADTYYYLSIVKKKSIECKVLIIFPLKNQNLKELNDNNIKISRVTVIYFLNHKLFLEFTP